MKALEKALAMPTQHYRVEMPFQGLRSLFTPLRGNLIVALGSPGVGKSAYALNWSLKNEDPSLLISLDTDLHTQAARAAAILGGGQFRLGDITSNVLLGSSILNKSGAKLRAYDEAGGTKDIYEIIEAEKEYWGVPPALTIVDNVSNLVNEGDYQEYRRLFVELHRVARKGNTCVLALHHVTRKAKFGEPLNLNSGQFAGEQEAEVVLGLWSDRGDPTKGPRLNVSVLKNRMGKADPSGAMYVPLVFEQDTMTIRDETAADKALAVLLGDDNGN